MNSICSITYTEAPKGNLWRFCLVLLFFVGTMVTPAQAHRAHAGLTEITWNKSTQEIEITHRLYAHDIEPRLFRVALSGWEETPEGIEKIGTYCAAKFSITIDEKTLPLTYVGAEPDGEFVYIYFTASGLEEDAELLVNNTMLANAFDDQVNLVNLTLNGQTQSQYFRFGDQAKPMLWSVPAAD